jgi:iron complex outermembrane receptor protein
MRGKSLLTILVSVAAWGPNVGVFAETTPEADQTRLEEVVVTARKTEESLQRVPVSIVAITGEELVNRSLDSLSAVGQATPNLTFGQQAQGGKGAGVIYIRGVGQADTLATYDPAVGVYIDGVYLGRMQGNDLDMMGVERLEILRGPQGTLFGKNTSGGAVSIITKQPDVSADTPSGRVQITGGSLNRADVVGSINIPLVTDKAALLLSGSRRSQDGYGERVDGESMGSTNRDAGKASLLLTPTSNFNALLAVDGITFHETNAVEKLVAVNTSAGPIAALNALTPYRYDDRWLSPSDFFDYGTGPNSDRGHIWGTTLTLNLNEGWANIKSISALRKQDTHNDLDADVSPIAIVNYYQETIQHQYSQELQATGKAVDERLDWVLGAYYFREAVYDNNPTEALVPLFGDTASFDQINTIDNESLAGYGQGTYNLTERLRFTLGLRYTHDKKEDERGHTAFMSDLPTQPTITKALSSNDVSPRVGFDYQWSPTIMTYISAAKGYKAGGFNGRAGTVADFNEFNPEVVKTYELGLRSDFFDRRIRFNATAFYSDYTDLQLEITGSTVVNGAPVPFQVVTNVPKSRIVGGELELDVVPATGLTLTSGLGLTYAKYTSLPTDAEFVASELINTNSQFVNTPKVSFSLGAEYTTHVTQAIDATGRIDYSHKTTINYDPTNSPLLRQSAYGLLDARLTFEYVPSKISLAIFGTNLTNKHYIVGGYDDADTPTTGLGVAFQDMAPPREWGVTAEIRF